jgi:NAD(P)-dependent dehydrogenase (short-subunit alcohol dehydrogenase family)
VHGPLAGRVALVTGASSGIGRAVAIALAEDGADVCLVARDRDRLELTARQIAMARSSAHSVLVGSDVSSKQACEAAVDRCHRELGAVDVLVSVAGGADNADVLSLDRDLVTAAIDVKLLSTLWLSQLVAEEMTRRGWGRIITVAGAAGTDPRPNNLATSFANVTALGLTRALSDALSRSGITVNAVCPGPTDTERWRRNLTRRSAAQGIPPEVLQAGVEAEIPAGRVGTAAEVAAVVRFLASEPASYVHGNAIYLDGGARRGLP